MSRRFQLMSKIKRNEELNIFQRPGINRINFNIKSKKLVEMKINSDKILQDLNISQK